MTPIEIDAATRAIRPLLARELSLCRAVYPPTHPDASQVTDKVLAALEAFDRLVLYAKETAQPKAATQ